jgi:hypothetical protein
LESTTVTPPIDVTKVSKQKKNDKKDRLLILDVVRDHIIPHILRKKIPREIWEAMNKLIKVIMNTRIWFLERR